MMFRACCWVALGGTVGSLARHLLTLAIGGPSSTGGFPVATLLINVMGAFLLGVVITVFAQNQAGTGGGSARRDTARRDTARLLLGTGLLGGFTTYSLLASDLAEMLLGTGFAAASAGSDTSGSVGLAAAYAMLTLFGGAAASWGGIVVGGMLVPAPEGSAAGAPAEPTTGREGEQR